MAATDPPLYNVEWPARARAEPRHLAWYEAVSGPAAFVLSRQPGGSGAALPATPLVPDVLVRHGGPLTAKKDWGSALAESCIVRSVMAVGGGACPPPPRSRT